MWIKSLDREVWVNMNHITHFAVKMTPNQSSEPDAPREYAVGAYLDTSKMAGTPQLGLGQDQAFVFVYVGTLKKCKKFIKKKLRWQSISQWIGYLVAGGLGAVLTYLLGLLKS